MAIVTTRLGSELGTSWVLAPERYDPRRETLRTTARGTATVLLSSVARIARQTISASTSNPERQTIRVLDTSDVREGFVIGRKPPIHVSELGSLKKLFQVSDVLISRLRPYLRQVALVDHGVGDDDSLLACSTEFFILRSTNDESIAFLVPFLLSASVQSVLAASQEGGHHPRFDEDILAALPIPETMLARRKEISEAVEKSAKHYRDSERIMLGLIADIEQGIPAKTKKARRTTAT